MKNNTIFKAKRKHNGEWVEGFYCPIKYYDFDKHTFEFKTVIISEFSSGGIIWCEVDPDTICQWTGLYDQTKFEELSEMEQRAFLDSGKLSHEWKGRKIWENDIIRVYDFTADDFIAKWSEEKAAFVIVYAVSKIECEDLVSEVFDGADYVSVVGNIFDNPELQERQE